jgi:hypothetical protein
MEVHIWGPMIPRHLNEFRQAPIITRYNFTVTKGPEIFRRLEIKDDYISE